MTTLYANGKKFKMSLINKIKADLLQARKSRDKLTARLLTILYNDCMKVGYTVDGVRSPSDSECLAVVKKTVENLRYWIEFKQGRGDLTPVEDEDMKVLMWYLPKQLDEDQLRTVIGDLMFNGGCYTMGAVMKALKEDYDGCYDPRRASGIARELISQIGE